MIANTLREWRLQCPTGDENLVFPTGAGSIENHSNLVQRILDPAQVSAGVVDNKGKPKYGMHSLRHFYASWCINRKADGGLELPPKTVQVRLCHASIVMTLDRYGHLFFSRMMTLPNSQTLRKHCSRHDRDTDANYRIKTTREARIIIRRSGVRVPPPLPKPISGDL